MHRGLPVIGERSAAREQAFVLVDVQRCDAGRAGHRMRRVGIAVEQLDLARRSGHQRIVDPAAREHGAHRDRAVGDTLGGGDEIGRDAEIVGCERRAEPAEPGDDRSEHAFLQSMLLFQGLKTSTMVFYHLLHHVVRAPHLAQVIIHDLSDRTAVVCPQRLPDLPPDPNYCRDPEEEWYPGDKKAHVPGNFFIHCRHPLRTTLMTPLIAEVLKQLINEMPVILAYPDMWKN